MASVLRREIWAGGGTKAGLRMAESFLALLAESRVSSNWMAEPTV